MQKIRAKGLSSLAALVQPPHPPAPEPVVVPSPPPKVPDLVLSAAQRASQTAREQDGNVLRTTWQIMPEYRSGCRLSRRVEAQERLLAVLGYRKDLLLVWESSSGECSTVRESVIQHSAAHGETVWVCPHPNQSMIDFARQRFDLAMDGE